MVYLLGRGNRGNIRLPMADSPLLHHDENDPQYAISKEAYDYLSSETDAKGRKLEIHKLYVPSPVLITKEEMPFAKDLGNYYCVSPDSRNLNYQKETKKKYKEETFSEYTSNNTKILNLEETIELLKSLDLFN